MPCHSELSSQEIEVLHKYNEVQMRLACDRCKELEARGGEVPDWAKEWWAIHKQRDEQQRKHEEEAARSFQIRQQAILKLTSEERNELGV